VAVLSDEVRRRCARVAAAARWVEIDERVLPAAGGSAGLDPGLHFLHAPAEEVARYVLLLDAVNFGSGWFDALGTGTGELTRRLTAHARARGGTWSASELRGLTAGEVAAVLGLPAGHELTGLYARALNQLGEFLGSRAALDVVAAASGSAQRLARQLAEGMPFFADRGFYKRAQIAANDLVLAGVADFADVDRLTVFADNLLPHVLRIDGVLRYTPDLAARVDAGRELPAGGPMEREIRACAVHACEKLAARLGVPPRTLDNWLWNRGLRPPYDRLPAHRTRTVHY
jgi:Potential Queuosine, Q, salvage protein family